MNKVKQAVDVYLVKVYCEHHRDRETELEFTGNMLTSYPAQYVHYCSYCDERYNLDKVYPALEYSEWK